MKPRPESAEAESNAVLSAPSLQPLGARLIVRKPEAPAKIGRFWIPPAAQDDFVVCQAEVVARGNHVKDWRLQPGAHVIVKRFKRVALGDAEWAVWESEVLALVDTSVL